MTLFQTTLNLGPVDWDLEVSRETGEVRPLTPAGKSYAMAESPQWPDVRLMTEIERLEHAVAVVVIARLRYRLKVRFDDEYSAEMTT